MDLITETIEKSWYKYDPFLTDICIHLLKKLEDIHLLKKLEDIHLLKKLEDIHLLKKLEEYQIPKGEKGFNKCWLFQQILFMTKKDLEKKGKRLDISYGWFKEGVVVDPGLIMILTKGKIKFKWEDDCPGCQIEDECSCIGNPHNNNYEQIEEKLNWLWRYK